MYVTQMDLEVVLSGKPLASTTTSRHLANVWSPPVMDAGPMSIDVILGTKGKSTIGTKKLPSPPFVNRPIVNQDSSIMSRRKRIQTSIFSQKVVPLRLSASGVRVPSLRPHHLGSTEAWAGHRNVQAGRECPRREAIRCYRRDRDRETKCHLGLVSESADFKEQG